MKRNIVLLAAIALIFSGCRKVSDYHPYIGESGSLAYDSYATQFEFLWKSLSSGYVFWDVDTTDWDAVFDEYIPRFQALDTRYEEGGDVTLADMDELYEGAMGKMIDHHMTVAVKNIHPSPNDVALYLTVRPGATEVGQRDYYIEPRNQEQANIITFIDGMSSQYNIEAHEAASAFVEEIGGSVTYRYCLIVLPDGRKIPYLWQSMAAITPVMKSLGGVGPEAQAAALIDHWLTAIIETPRAQLAGIILDNRANSGGYQDDLDYLIGTFLDHSAEIFKTRYKEGPGRLEHSVWTPYYINPNLEYHRDITTENIPYVVICDINSVSMGEIEPMTIKAVLPTAYIVGERTYGGTGPLQPATSINLNYGGPFGDLNTNTHYVYTSTFESLIGGKVMEGIGITPDKVVLRKDYDGDFKPQLDAAIDYITSIQ